MISSRLFPPPSGITQPRLGPPAGRANWWRGLRARSTLKFSGATLTCQGLHLAGLMFAATRVEAAQFGVMAFGLMLVGLCNALRNVGQDPALNSLPRLDAAHVRCHFLLTVALGAFAAGVLFAVVWGGRWFVDLRPSCVWLAGLVFTEAVCHTPQIVTQRRFKFGWMATVEVTAAGVWLALTVAAALGPRTADALLAAACLEYVVRTVGLLLVEPGCLRPAAWTAATWRYFGRYARILFVQAWALHLVEHLDLLLLRGLGTAADAGLYKGVQQAMRVPQSLSYELVSRVASASYSEDQGETPHLRRTVRGFAGLMAAGLGIGLVIVAVTLLWPRGGAGNPPADLRGGMTHLWWWAIPFCLARPFYRNFNLVFQTTGRPHQLRWSVLLNVSAILVLGLVATPLFGVRGLFVAVGLGEIVSVAFQAWCYARAFPADGAVWGAPPPRRRGEEAPELIYKPA